MPHVGAASGGEDLASSDEIKVFKDEGDEEENRSSENLTDLKSSLVTEGEEVSWVHLSFLFKIKFSIKKNKKQKKLLKQLKVNIDRQWKTLCFYFIFLSLKFKNKCFHELILDLQNNIYFA